MALAEELLDNISEEQAAEYALSELKPHIVIDEDRNIILPERYKKIASQGDHNMATYTFDCPRFSDERDMSKMVVYINYIRSDGEVGSYPADNVSIDAQNTDLMHFDWTLLLPATIAEGVLAFLVCVCRTGNDGKIENHWSSRICREAMISEGMDCHTDTIVDLYPDIITRILERLSVLEDGGTTSVQYTIQDLEEEQKVQARKNIEAADAKEVSKLSEDIATKASAIKEKASGEVIVVTDSDEEKPLGLAIDGKSEQDGEPTPDNPIEIVNVGKYDEASGKYAVEVKCTGKNLLQNTAVSKTQSGITITVDDDGVITVNGTSTAIVWIDIKNDVSFNGGLHYILSGCPTGGDNSTYFAYANSYPINDIGKGVDISYDEDTTTNIGVCIRNGVTVSNLTFKPMIRLAEITDDTYEPYKETTATVLLDEPLRKGDKVSWNGGKMLVERNRAVEVYDGSDDEKWKVVNTETDGLYRMFSEKHLAQSKLPISAEHTSDGLCTAYKEVSSAATHRKTKGIAISIKGTVYVYDSDFNTSDISLWKAHLAENPFTLEYPLATPITEEIEIDLDSLSMFYPTTIISNDCNANMEVTYIADTKAYIDKKFAELATAMV